MFNKLKTYFHILLFVIPFTICSLIFSSRSYGLEATALSSALWNSYNLASEYYVARAGRNIVNANKISTDITDVTGINNGSMSEAYGDIVSSTQGGTPINVSNLLALAKDVDTSNMSLSELNALSVQLSGSPWNTDGSIVMKNIAYGGVSLYFAVDRLGEWIGNSYDNIVAKFGNMTLNKATNIASKAETIYPQTTSLRGYTNSLSCKFGRTSYQGQTADVLGYVSFSQPVYFYSVQQVNDTNEYYVGVMRPSDYAINQNYTGSFTYYTISTGESHIRFIDYVGLSNSHTVTYNGVSYVYGTLQISVENNSSSGSVTTYGQIATLSDAQNFFQGLNANTNTEYQSELLDTSGVPYLVDDLGDYATTIGDLYPVLEALRETISTIPTTDDLSSIISDEVKAEITELIDGIKSKNLTIDDAITDTGDIADTISQGIDIPPDLPTGVLDNFGNVIKLPFRFFSIFSPIFQIFGASSAVFGLWLFFPSFLIIMLIIWALK